ncbi:MAG TPA: TerC family protein [Gemmatimonadaceae bacterium]|nr:TerC family protein [Gemmatimonadaceae bacterium]
MTNLWWWAGFNAVVLTLLAVDLGVFHRRAHRVRVREAAVWSAVWVTLSLSFGAGVYFVLGKDKGIEFLTGYLIEYALSVDNIFVFVLIFSYFRIPAEYQHRVLFWGILGALIFRGTMIAVGVALIARFDWVLYVFGAFLVYTGIRMGLQNREEAYDPESNPTLRLVRRIFPVTTRYHGQKFFVREQRGTETRLVATPLFVALALVETTDIIFATDSIPAIFAVTRDPFIVYSSNVCAVLGLRALYFLLAGIVDRFHYLQLGLSVVLVFIGGKMLLEEIYHIPTLVSLAVIASVLSISVAASLLWPGRRTPGIPPLAHMASRHHEHPAGEKGNTYDGTPQNGQ